MDNTNIKLQVIIGSVRPTRFGDKPAHWILGEAKKIDGVDVELVDLKEWAIPSFTRAASPSTAKDGYGDEKADAFAKKIAEADAYIIVTPEYNHGYPGSLKDALDAIYKEWNNKPVAFVGYGSVGGARSIEQLRQVAIELQMAPIRAAVHLPSEVYMAVMKETVPADSALFAPVAQKATDMLAQLMWWARALKVARQ